MVSFPRLRRVSLLSLLGCWQVNDYTVIKTLGQGGFAVVKLAKYPDNASSPMITPSLRSGFVVRLCCRCVGSHTTSLIERPVVQAIKVFSKSALKKKKEFVKVGNRRGMVTALDKAHKELAIMKKVRHPNVVSCYEIIDDVEGDGLYLGMHLVHAALSPRPCSIPLCAVQCWSSSAGDK
jgi:serine/threonine protein kinase